MAVTVSDGCETPRLCGGRCCRASRILHPVRWAHSDLGLFPSRYLAHQRQRVSVGIREFQKFEFVGLRSLYGFNRAGEFDATGLEPNSTSLKV